MGEVEGEEERGVKNNSNFVHFCFSLHVKFPSRIKIIFLLLYLCRMNFICACARDGKIVSFILKQIIHQGTTYLLQGVL